MQTQDFKTMRGKSPATGLLYCREAKEFLEALTEAVRDLVLLHTQQFQSLIEGDLDSTRFDDLIHMANERKREAKYAYLNHLEEHGCSKQGII
jgi:tRNA splicing endonuclease